PLTVRALQVRHWGARWQTDRHRGYNGYLLDMNGKRIVFGGDTANTDLFRAARVKGPVDLAIMPIGAYNPWIHAHCTPEQAVRMASDANADRILPIHHKTFRLSAEPFAEPVERFREAARDRAVGGDVGDTATLV
ncbi:MAG: MBL fold metallo-hydrolase, partial [Bryobacteraceae bacterium]